MIKRLIIGIKCLFGHHTEDPYVHIIYGCGERVHTEDPYVHIIYGCGERVNVCLCCRKEFKPLKAD